jgi:hypothetical protein
MRRLLALLLLAIAPASAQTVTMGMTGQTTMLFNSTAVVGNGVDTTEDTLYTATIPAGTLANVGSAIHFVMRGTAAASTDVKVIRLKFGGTNVAALTNNAVGQATWWFDVWLWKTGSNTQFTVAVANNAGNNTTNATSTAAIADTAAITVLVTGQNSTNSVLNSIQTTGMIIWAVPGM